MSVSEGAPLDCSRGERRGALGTAAACGLYALVLGSLSYVKTNDYGSRYLAPVFLALPVACFGLAFRQVVLPDRVVAAGLLIAALFGWGLPSPSRPRAELERTLGPSTRRAVEPGCTLLAGNYFLVWPVAFYAALEAADHGHPPPFWPLTHRARVLEAQWDRRKLCAVEGDPEADKWLGELGFSRAEATGLSFGP